MTQDEAILCARNFLHREDAVIEEFLRSEKIHRNHRDQWAVIFRFKKPQGFESMLSDRVIVIVDDITKETSIFPSL
jgi:hypothetical protein